MLLVDDLLRISLRSLLARDGFRSHLVLPRVLVYWHHQPVILRLHAALHNWLPHWLHHGVALCWNSSPIELYDHVGSEWRHRYCALEMSKHLLLVFVDNLSQVELSTSVELLPLDAHENRQHNNSD